MDDWDCSRFGPGLWMLDFCYRNDGGWSRVGNTYSKAAGHGGAKFAATAPNRVPNAWRLNSCGRARLSCISASADSLTLRSVRFGHQLIEIILECLAATPAFVTKSANSDKE
jgi:hypothetical protein